VSQIVATGERVTIERLGPEDEQEFLDAVIASRDLHHPWIDAPDTSERFAAVLSRNDRPGNSTFLIRDRSDGTLAGAVNVTETVFGSFLSAFCGYWAFESGQGRGLMTDGLTTVVRHAFDGLGLHRLEANIQPANERSIALALRCGFRLEGFSPHYLKVDGAWRDHNRYAITVEDIPDAASAPH
jgi:[ribosomal protein S5]-alanine N-acetyltransferase